MKIPLVNPQVKFFRDYLRPFAARFTRELRSVLPRAVLFVEGDAFGETELLWSKSDPDNVVNATHWYDGFTLFMRKYNSFWTLVKLI